MTRAPLDVYTRGGLNKGKTVAQVVTLPGGQFYAAGRIFRSKGDAEAAAARLAVD